MKTIGKTIILLVILFVSTQTKAQDDSEKSVAISGTNLAAYDMIRDDYSRDIQDRVFQSFGYYNNPEIRKLEGEVSKLASLYRKDKFGKRGFSSDKYQSLTSDEKKIVKNISNSYSLGGYLTNIDADYVITSDTHAEKDKNPDNKAEEFFEKFVAPYLVGDKEKTINKQKLEIEIKRRLEQLFEMKENEKQKDITKLEQQLHTLQATLSERKKNKQQIIDQRMNELVGLPNTLKW